LKKLITFAGAFLKMRLTLSVKPGETDSPKHFVSSQTNSEGAPKPVLVKYREGGLGEIEGYTSAT